MFGAILMATNSSFQKGMTFCRSTYEKKVMKLLAFIFEQPSYRLGHYRIRNQGYCVRRLISTELHLSVFSAETISSEKMSVDISNTLKLVIL